MLEEAGEVIENVAGDMFGRGINIQKGRKGVEIAVVKGVNDHFYMFFQYLEINTHAKLIKLVSPDRYGNFPVVAMGIFAIAWVVAEMMGAGKVSRDENVVHEKLLKGYISRLSSRFLVKRDDPCWWNVHRYKYDCPAKLQKRVESQALQGMIKVFLLMIVPDCAFSGG